MATPKKIDYTDPVVVVVGYTAATVPNLWKILDLPAPPKGTKDPEKIRAWWETTGNQKASDIEHGAAYGKLTGTLKTFFAADMTGRILRHDGVRGKNLSVGFLEWLLARHPNAFPRYARDTRRRDVAIYGFDAKQFTRIVWAEAVKHGFDAPIGFGYMNEDVFDPYDMLVESTRRKGFSLLAVLKELGIAVRPNYIPHVDAQEDCRIVTEMVLRRKLAPPLAEEWLQKAITTKLSAAEVPAKTAETVESAEPEEVSDRFEGEAVAENEEVLGEEPDDEEEGAEEEDAEEEDAEDDEEEDDEEEDEEEEDEGDEYDDEPELPPEPEPEPKRRARRSKGR